MERESTQVDLPVLSLTNKVLFPATYLRVFITAPAGLALFKNLIYEAQLKRTKTNRPAFLIGVFTNRPKHIIDMLTADPEDENSNKSNDSNLHDVGTLARVVQLTRTQNAAGHSVGLMVLLQGLYRIRISSFIQQQPFQIATVQYLPGENENDTNLVSESTYKLKQLTLEYLSMTSNNHILRDQKGLSKGLQGLSISDLTDVAVSQLDIDVDQKQSFLEETDVKIRCEKIISLINREIESIQKVKDDRKRRENILRNRLEAVRNQVIGRENNKITRVEDQDDGSDANQLEKKINSLNLPEDIHKVAMREFRRFKSMNSSQPEHSLLQNYLEFMTDLPWNTITQDHLSVRAVQAQLDADHFGLEKVKRRITEYIAVRSLKKDMKGPILCLVGPPGVGKTSLGKSIAAACGRRFERIALGGVHDESEIRGHRKTYIGAMSGCILNALRHAGSKNPVLLLDEVDKLGKDIRGDPASALLEVIDPHQNDSFKDHYLNVPFDLSQAMFIATANSLDTIPAPLLDRMEIIEVSGYSVEQKMEIAQRYLLPCQLKENGLNPTLVRIPPETLRFIIRGYTREAGVRDLERQLAAICRHVAINVVKELDIKQQAQKGHTGNMYEESNHTQNSAQEQDQEAIEVSNMSQPDLSVIKPVTIDSDMVERILGHEIVFNEVALRTSVPGVATGMSWSSVGGSILFVEASVTYPSPISTPQEFSDAGIPNPNNSTLTPQSTGLPNLLLTGKLGDVMKESAMLALSWIRVNAPYITLPSHMGGRISLHGISSVHVHFPEGAISKDGPSAGGAIVCALLSALSGIVVPTDLSMTGEITLRGVILPVGGIREKVLGAWRAGIKRIVLPVGNRPEAEEIVKEFPEIGLSDSSSRNSRKHEDVQIYFVRDLHDLVQLVFGMSVVRKQDECFSSNKRSALMSML